MTSQEAGSITYSYGQRRDLTERPAVHGADMWQVHYYTHADHRTTWDISRGRVYAAYEESWVKEPRRSHHTWRCVGDVHAPAPISL